MQEHIFKCAGVWVCDEDSCRTLDDENQATEKDGSRGETRETKSATKRG